jgi:oligoribonuclease (3'-5' exoribonuclease)
MNLIFLDLETTGTDETNPRAEILEIGMLAIHPQTLQELAAWSTPIKAHCFTGEWDPKVVEMHSASGLLDELRGPRSHLQFAAGGLPTLAEAQAQAIGFFAANGGRTHLGQSPLCGANPDFDRRWLKARGMPQLENLFHYRSFDTNCFWQLRNFIAGQPAANKAGTAHRALADCRQSVQTLRTFLGG